MDIIRYLHIAIGTIALLSGAISIIVVKGSRLHRQAGKWYVYSMFFVVASAVYMSITRQNDFLLSIAIFSFYLTWTGKRAVDRNISGDSKRYLFDHFVMLVASIGCVYMLYKGFSNIILLVFGGVLFFNIFVDLKEQLKKKTVQSTQLMTGHIGRMCGAYIATVTAFLVNTVTTTFPLVLWLGPTLVGGTFIAYSIMKWKKNMSDI